MYAGASGFLARALLVVGGFSLVRRGPRRIGREVVRAKLPCALGSVLVVGDGPRLELIVARPARRLEAVVLQPDRALCRRRGARPPCS